MASKSINKLYRSEKNNVIAGVAGGIAEHFNIDPVIARVLFAASLMINGFGLPAYILMWIFIPKKSSLKLASDKYIKENAEEIKNKAGELSCQSGPMSKHIFFGILLIIIGGGLLLNNLGIFRISGEVIWPLILISLGISILFK